MLSSGDKLATTAFAAAAQARAPDILIPAAAMLLFAHALIAVSKASLYVSKNPSFKK
jgi:hypothetical protein